MVMSATAKLFTHGGSQAVRLPKAFRFEGTEVSVRKEGDAVILEPMKVQQESWEAFWARIDALGDGEDFPDAPPDPPSGLDDPIIFDE
ncbi:AbrB/MazE/SpoVT family DNA-binding domain-containing protein [Caulobacter sp. S45]|uniref:antitoxin n=1 Tax=Caulobacter sp. S45 TaxID=1641861 RepID=UPI001C2D990E